MRRILLSILLSGIWFLSTAQTTSTLPSGYTPFATQLYYKVAGGDTTIVTGATGKGFHVIPTTQALRDSLDLYYTKTESDARFVPLTRTLTINGSAQNLSADRTWNVGTVTSITPGYGLTPQSAITSTGTFKVDTLVLDTVYAKKDSLKIYSKNTQGGISVVNLHYGALRGKGMTSGETPNLTYTVSSGVSSGATSVTLSSATGLVDQQLIAYLGTNGQYYSASISSIVGNVVTLAAPIEAAIGAGVNVFSFYANESHASVYGFRAIADYIVRTNKTQYTLESRAQMTVREGGTSVTPHNLNNLGNPGSAGVNTSSVNIPTALSDELRAYFTVKSTGNYVARLTINTLGVDVKVSAYYNGGRVFTDTINTLESTLVDIPIAIYDDLSSVSVGLTTLVNGANFLVTNEVPVLKVTGVAPDLTSGKIVLLGDSWFELPGIYERLVDQLPGSIIVNKGVGGNRAESLVNRFDADVKPEKPDVVVVIVGTNDYYRPDALVEYTLGINRLKQKVSEIGAHMVLLTSSVGAAELDTARFNLSRQYANFTKMYDEDISVVTTLGDLIYGNTYGYPTRLAGNTTTTKKYLTQTGNSINSAAPVWEDLPAPTVYVSQTITDGVTAYAPSENVVFDALALKAPLESPTFTGTVSGITKSMVGLGNVDNTTDLLKPISTATQSALDLKANIASPAFTGTGTIPSLHLNASKLRLGADGSYGSSYSTIGFGGTSSNGDNRIFAGNDLIDDIYIAAGTGKKVNIWANGGTSNLASFASTGITFSSLSGSGNILAYADNTGLLGKVTIGSGLSLTGTTLSATGGSAGTITGSGTAGKIAKFNSASDIGNSIMTEAGSDISIAGSLSATSINANGGELMLKQDVTYGSGYSTVSFGGTGANGDNRIFAGNDNSDDIFVAAGTGRKVILRANGSTGDVATFSSSAVTLNQALAATSGVFSSTLSASNLSGTNTGDQTWTTLSGKPSFATVATSGDYNDLINKPTITSGTVTSVGATAGTGISVSGSPITTSGSITITNTAPDQTVSLTAGTGISTSGTYPNFTITNTSPSLGGTVSSIASGAGMGFSTITGTGTITMGTPSSITSSSTNSTSTTSHTHAITSLPSATTATTQTAGDNSTKVATTAYVDNALGAAGTYPFNDITLPGTTTYTFANWGDSPEFFVSGLTVSGNITINLPAAGLWTGKIIHVKKRDTSGNSITVDGNGTDTIDGSLTKVITGSYTSFSFYSNGTTIEIF